MGLSKSPIRLIIFAAAVLGFWSMPPKAHAASMFSPKCAPQGTQGNASSSSATSNSTGGIQNYSLESPNPGQSKQASSSNTGTGNAQSCPRQAS